MEGFWKKESVDAPGQRRREMGDDHMKIRELTEEIEKRIPLSLALDWDNVGLLVGDEEREVQTVYLALDATDAVIREATASGADLLLTHHPLIFGGCRRISSDDFVGRRVLALAQHQIACYAMHTNFDVAVMGTLAAKKFGLLDLQVLDVTYHQPETMGIGCVGHLMEVHLLQELAVRTREVFGLSHVKVFGAADAMIQRIAISPGSGKGEVDAAIAAGAQVLITGDIDHHTGLDAQARGLRIIDAGHYGIEHIYVDYMEQFLQEIAPELSVIKAKKQEPFWII
jgi:dinuclear metal center YbgI/SA1388 family protein